MEKASAACRKYCNDFLAKVHFWALNQAEVAMQERTVRTKTECVFVSLSHILECTVHYHHCRYLELS